MIYTTYFAQLKKLPKDIIPIAIFIPFAIVNNVLIVSLLLVIFLKFLFPLQT